MCGKFFNLAHPKNCNANLIGSRSSKYFENEWRFYRWWWLRLFYLVNVKLDDQSSCQSYGLVLF